MRIMSLVVLLFLPCAVLAHSACSGADSTNEPKALRAGAAAVDVSPEQFPVIVSGGFLEKQANVLNDPLFARAMVLDDGATRLAIVVVDTLVMPRDMLDGVKAEIQAAAEIPTDHILISATHTHSAPSLVGALGTGVDPHYVELLPERIVRCVCQAAENLAPAQVGWTVVFDDEHTNCRRWIRRPDRVGEDPFGQRTVRAMMHPGYQNPDYVGPAGPDDPYLTILAVRAPEGKPIAVVANYSMHYYGARPISADYYGRFVRGLTARIGNDGTGNNEDGTDPPVVMMSQGTSGDLHWMDYANPAKPRDIDVYAEAVVAVAHNAYQTIEYHDRVPLAMAETTLTLQRRLPDEQRLAWAQGLIDAMGDRKPKDRPEVYAREQFCLAAEPERELKLQALRIGELGITAIPCEVYGITGLKLKAQSPLGLTFNVELANGHEGYIPPPEQHALGGYTTWPARSAGLEKQAEPKIVDAVLGLLEQVSGQPRRKAVEPPGSYTQAVLDTRPVAYWRLGEFCGPRAVDASEHGNHAVYEDGVAFYLKGPELPGFCGADATKRAAHFAGGRMKAELEKPTDAYTVEFWFYNGLPNDVRPVTGYLFSRGVDGEEQAHGDHLGIGGTSTLSDESRPGVLFFYNGDTRKETLIGKTEIQPNTWNHVMLVRDSATVSVFLNGNTAPEISGTATVTRPDNSQTIFVGGRNDNFANFEGKIAEVSLYDRPLTIDEMTRHHAASLGSGRY